MSVHHAPVGASTREGLIPPGDYNVDQNGFITSGPYYGRQIAGYPLQFSQAHQQVPATAHVGNVPQQPWRPEDREAVAAGVRQSRDRSQYVRQQKGHSLILHLLLGGFVLWIPAIYFTASPNHYWHA